MRAPTALWPTPAGTSGAVRRHARGLGRGAGCAGRAPLVHAPVGALERREVPHPSAPARAPGLSLIAQPDYPAS